MNVASPPSDPEIAAEQAALNHALASLGSMRGRAEKLLADLIAAGNPDLDYVAALSRRVALLADSPRPLLFGRIDEEDGPTWRIGRRHVEDARSDPVVIEGVAHISTEPAVLQRVIDLMNAKYRTDFGVDFLDPAINATVGVRPRRVFSLRAGDFTGSPTRWIFED